MDTKQLQMTTLLSTFWKKGFVWYQRSLFPENIGWNSFRCVCIFLHSQRDDLPFPDSPIHPRLVSWCGIQTTSKRSRSRNKQDRICTLRLGENANSKEGSLKSFHILNTVLRQMVITSNHLPQSTYIPKMDGLSIGRQRTTSNGVVQRFMSVAAKRFGIYVFIQTWFYSSVSLEDRINHDKPFLSHGYESICTGEGTNRYRPCCAEPPTDSGWLQLAALYQSHHQRSHTLGPCCAFRFFVFDNPLISTWHLNSSRTSPPGHARWRV